MFCRTCVGPGFGPGPAKSLYTIPSNSFNVELPRYIRLHLFDLGKLKHPLADDTPSQIIFEAIINTETEEDCHKDICGKEQKVMVIVVLV